MKSFTVCCAIVWWECATYDSFSFSVCNLAIRSEIVSSKKKKKKKAITPLYVKMRRCCGANSKTVQYNYKSVKHKNQYGGRPLADMI